ncbi:NACHT domain-containing protein [Colletotrichum kahawae]|uniref:NACHT domain-containing protein n=1 Tax=Colletotrichum kahawae TaxID=34407 RepID=A0AAE0DA22_COLKA|nr:NACHT domain-containing protein [Colletotrichum kahawae]
MADMLLQRAGERFCAHLSDEEKGTIESMQKLDDVRFAIRQVEQHLAARQSLRNLQRLSPFLEATERLAGFIDVLANGTPFLPYVWAPLKLILRAAQDHSKVLEKIITAYASIGMALPRMTRYGDTFPDNYELQQLLGHLLEDIIDFHSRAYRLMRKPGWQFFFSAAWGRFEHYFDSLLQGIARNSELIDKEAASVDIIEAREWRQKSRELAAAREKKWETDQRDAVIRWLQDGDTKQDDALEWLRNRCFEGTSQWLLKSSKVRSWLQYRKGPQILWLNGKPGSGKSILCSQLIHFLRTNKTRACLFFFCNYQTPGFAVTVQVLRNICAQVVRMSPDLAPYIYDEYLTKGRTPTLSALKPLLLELFKSFEDIRIIVDGVDEIDSGQHTELLKTVTKLVETTENCKLLVSSQDIPSIKMNFRGKPSFSVGAESSSIEVKKDIDLILGVRLEEINDRFEGAVSQTVLDEMRREILNRANGMFL